MGNLLQPTIKTSDFYETEEKEKTSSVGENSPPRSPYFSPSYEPEPTPENVKKFVRKLGGAKALHLMGYTPLKATDETFWMDDEEIADYINYPYRREKNKAIHKPLDFDQRLNGVMFLFLS